MRGRDQHSTRLYYFDKGCVMIIVKKGSVQTDSCDRYLQTYNVMKRNIKVLWRRCQIRTTNNGW